MSRVLDIAVIPGDGIGPEVTAEALKVLRAAVRSRCRGARNGIHDGRYTLFGDRRDPD